MGANPDTSDDATIQDLFRRHFEAQFKPLTVATKKQTKKKKNAAVLVQENDNAKNGEDEALSEGSDWSGLSDKDSDEKDGAAPPPAVQVVDYSVTATRDTRETTMTKHERKLYLSSRPPSSFDDHAHRTSTNKKRGESGDSNAEKQYKDAPELLADDLALQRLISESHLLSGAFSLPSSFSTSSSAASTFGAAGSGVANHKSNQPFAAGRLRQRATDLRIQAVANKAKGGAGAGDSLITVNRASDSIFTQVKMPMSKRKGMAAAAAARETKRRQEARETGIVLERPAAVKPTKTSKRFRAVDAPAVGRMRGSELRLRERDVRAIEGPKKAMGKKKKKRR